MNKYFLMGLVMSLFSLQINAIDDCGLGSSQSDDCAQKAAPKPKPVDPKPQPIKKKPVKKKIQPEAVEVEEEEEEIVKPAPAMQAFSVYQHRLASGGLSPEMVALPGGTFNMGSDQEYDEKPIHGVKIKPFAIGKYEVTLGEFKAFIRATGYSVGTVHWCNWDSGKFAESDQQPVQCVSWNDATKYVQWLSKETGYSYRLPTEAEWEYAAKAGTQSKWSFGDDESDLKYHAWYWENSDNKTHEVGQKKPNGFGLYDMYGNVGEWTCSNYGNYSENNHLNCSSNSHVNSRYHTNSRSIRGCSVFNAGIDNYCRSAVRYKNAPNFRDYLYGLRVVSVFNP